jgi:hypothetical protein
LALIDADGPGQSRAPAETRFGVHDLAEPAVVGEIMRARKAAYFHSRKARGGL